MLFQITLLVAMSTALSQARLFCLEDYTCPDDNFCEITTRVCRKCLNCSELNRQPSNPGKCVKTDEDCGPCFLGWKSRPMNYGTLLYGTKCVPTEVTKMSKEIYILSVGAGVLTISIIVIFLRILKNSSIFEVVKHYYITVPLAGIEEHNGTLKPICEK